MTLLVLLISIVFGSLAFAVNFVIVKTATTIYKQSIKLARYTKARLITYKRQKYQALNTPANTTTTYA